MKGSAGEDLSVAPRRLSAVLVIASAFAIHLAASDPTTEQIQFFESKIRPVLAENCYTCHSLNANPRFANLRLDSRAGMLAGGERGPAVVPGDPNASQLIQAVRHENLKMPPAGRLAEAKIAALVEWVEMGAPWPREEASADVESASKANPEDAAADHWAWQPVRKSTPPAVRNDDWRSNPIDHFILRKLESEDLAPNSDAGPLHTYTACLLRSNRACLLLPSRSASFASHDSEQAFDEVVDGLLESPDFGERWGRHWLDLTGYADKHRGWPAYSRQRGLALPRLRDLLIQ